MLSGLHCYCNSYLKKMIFRYTTISFYSRVRNTNRLRFALLRRRQTVGLIVIDYPIPENVHPNVFPNSQYKDFKIQKHRTNYELRINNRTKTLKVKKKICTKI